MDTKQISRNREVVEKDYLESPYNADMSDCDADYPGKLFGPTPKNKVGLLPENEKEK